MAETTTQSGDLAGEKDPENTLYVSYSLLNTFRNCRKLTEFKYVKGYDPYKKSKALAFGLIIHECLEIWHNTRDFNQVLEQLDKHYNDRTQDAFEMDTFLKAKAMLYGYAKRYHADDFEIVFLEREIKIPVWDMTTLQVIPNVKLVGRIDGVVKYQGDYYLLEHKTTSKIENNYKDRLDLK